MGIIAIPGFFEPFSAIAHLIAAVLALGLGVRFVYGAGHGKHRLALGIFVGAAVILFALSGSYHMLEGGGTGRAVLRRADHAAIFTMIAGTMTGIHGVAFRGRWRGGFLAVVWVLAITGLTLKTVFFESMSELMGLCLYLGLGWLGALSARALYRRFGSAGVQALMWGGVFYSVGALYDFFHGPALIDGVIGHHEIFHLAVVAGTLAHWQSIRTLLRLRAEQDDSAQG